jgi:hypothetical protein
MLLAFAAVAILVFAITGSPRGRGVVVIGPVILDQSGICFFTLSNASAEPWFWRTRLEEKLDGEWIRPEPLLVHDQTGMLRADELRGVLAGRAGITQMVAAPFRADVWRIAVLSIPHGDNGSIKALIRRLRSFVGQPSLSLYYTNYSNELKMPENRQRDSGPGE